MTTQINDLSFMVGKTIVKANDAKKGSDVLLFLMNDGSAYAFYHSQDCCEGVAIEDICGDLGDLVGSPLTQAEEVVSPQGDPPPECPDSWTWTFYKFATNKGSVTIRWLGESNGYYSESVDIEAIASGTPIPPRYLEQAPLALAAPTLS